MSVRKRSAGTSRIGLHAGRALVYLAEKYPGLTLALAETVQNAIDANASKIFIGVDQQERTVIVTDDGDGVTLEDFNTALAAIAESRKTSGPSDRIGQFGIGLIAPLTKCHHYEFMSWARSGSGPVGWHFQQSAIEAQRGDIGIPHVELEVMPPLKPPFASYATDMQAEWRTMVQMHEVSRDKLVSRIELPDLHNVILAKFGYHMHRKGVVCRVVLRDERGKLSSIDIKPQAPTGEPLGVFEVTDALGGAVVIELFKARLRGGKRQGQVGVSELEPVAPVAWNKFAAHVKTLDEGAWAQTEAFTALGSGYFEGLIRAKNLQLLPERDRFKATEGLKAVVIALDDWYVRVGQAFYEAEHERQQEERYTRIGLEALRAVKSILDQPEFQHLRQALQDRVQLGRVNQADGESGQGVGDDNPRLPSQRGDAEKRSSAGKSQSGADSSRNESDDAPSGVQGQKGRRRAVAQSDSVGLWFEVTDFEFNPRLWEFDSASGKIEFNSNHPIWMELDGSLARRQTARHDQQIQMLQEWVVLKVLQLLTLSTDQYDEARERIEHETPLFVRLFILRG